MQKYWIVGALIVVVFFGVIYATRGGVHPTVSNPQPATPVSNTKQFNLVVKGRKVVGDVSTLTAKQGDTISITITADESDELHLHGYDKSVEFKANQPATLTVVATQSGRFPFEMEGSKTDLGELDVLP